MIGAEKHQLIRLRNASCCAGMEAPDLIELLPQNFPRRIGPVEMRCKLDNRLPRFGVTLSQPRECCGKGRMALTFGRVQGPLSRPAPGFSAHPCAETRRSPHASGHAAVLWLPIHAGCIPGVPRNQSPGSLPACQVTKAGLTGQYVVGESVMVKIERPLYSATETSFFLLSVRSEQSCIKKSLLGSNTKKYSLNTYYNYYMFLSRNLPLQRP